MVINKTYLRQNQTQALFWELLSFCLWLLQLAPFLAWGPFRLNPEDNVLKTTWPIIIKIYKLSLSNYALFICWGVQIMWSGGMLLGRLLFPQEPDPQILLLLGKLRSILICPLSKYLSTKYKRTFRPLGTVSKIFQLTNKKATFYALDQSETTINNDHLP